MSVPSRPPLVISIQSQVVSGHVGNSAALFPLQAAGLEVAAIPTVIFSNTPDYPTLRGRALPGDFFADLLLGAAERGLPERADFIMSGYIGSAEVALQIADFIARAKAANPSLIYLCDPVLGDSSTGLYVPAEIAQIMRDRLLPQSDLSTPNLFELEWLSDIRVSTVEALQRAVTALELQPSAQLIATGCRLDDTGAGQIESVIIARDRQSRHPVSHQPAELAGTGDLFAALIVAGLASGRSLPEAVERGQILVGMALSRARRLGTKEIVLTDPDFRAQLLQNDRDSDCQR